MAAKDDDFRIFLKNEEMCIYRKKLGLGFRVCGLVDK